MTETMHLTTEGWVTDRWLRERADAGLDVFDEMVDGVIVLNPLPRLSHQRFGADLFEVLRPLARRRGLEALYEIGFFAAGDEDRNYRGPDLAVVHPSHLFDLGIRGGAALVVEIRSPGDRTDEKLPFYLEQGACEALLADPDTKALDLLRCGTHRFEVVAPDDQGWLRLQAIDLSLRTERDDREDPVVHAVGPGVDRRF
jgi:Uma2 family endonuclease